MRIFIGESDKYHGKPLYEALLEKFRQQGLAGATVLRGVAGFGASSKMHTDKVLRMVAEPILEVEVPVSGAVWSYRGDVVDSGPRVLPKALLHHFNLRDPDRRELFLPIGLHVMAASKGTPAASVPPLLFGLP